MSKEPEMCNWQRNEVGSDKTGCGGMWFLDEGTPADNSMKFCPYCGGLIEWHDYCEDET